MFHCEQGHFSNPGEVRISVVAEVRPVMYRTVKMVPDRKEGELKEVEVSFSRGTEVAQELAYCPEHAPEAQVWFTPPAMSDDQKEVVIVL